MSTPKKHYSPRECETCGKMFIPTCRTYKNCPECRRELYTDRNKYWKYKTDKEEKAEAEARKRKKEQDEAIMKSWARLLKIDYYQNYGVIRAYYIINKFSELKKRAPYLVPVKTAI